MTINKNTRIMMIDTETTNDIDCPIVYDVGFSIFDLEGTTYAERSYVNADIFLDKNLMQYAYFVDKVPQYWEEIKAGDRKLAKWYTITREINELMQKYNVEILCAHNARFDYRSMHLTQRYITTSKWRWVFPFGKAEWWYTLKMARAILKDNDDYTRFCFDNNFVTKNNRVQYTAEVIYRWLSNNVDFAEKHTGLEDVKIERQIFEFLISENPDFDGRLWEE